MDGSVLALRRGVTPSLKTDTECKASLHPQLKGLFPCGEGAGYAGGIASAAMDGELCANRVVDLYVNSCIHACATHEFLEHYMHVFKYIQDTR